MELGHQPWVRKSGNISVNISELISVSMFPHSDFGNKIDHVVTISPQFLLVEVNTESRTSSVKVQDNSQVLTNEVFNIT